MWIIEVYNIILSEGDAKYSITKIKYRIQILIAQMHINITSYMYMN